MAIFKKDLDKYSQLMDTNKVNKEMITEKKRFIQICSVQIESSTGKTLSFKEISSMLDLNIDDVEEWAISAINNDIIDARIDQINE